VTARKTTKRKPRKITKVVANRAIGDIKKLDLELKKIKSYIEKLLGHQYFK
jgi:hypothetical protein